MLDLIDIRRALHRIPERGHEESETSDKLFEIISELTRDRTDVAVERHRTAILVHVPGEDPSRTIGWRADMDGLPTAEESGLDFASTHEGFMHACGHDLHMACGLGILERVLAKKPKHSLVILFQPAEEGGGAKAVYESGVLDNIDEFYALHVSPQWEPGTVATRPGALCPNACELVVEFTGKPGHPGMPHLAVDPIVAAADFVLQIQTMVSRNFDPASGGIVLTFDTISGGSSEGAASPSARVAGTLRVLTKDQADLVFRRIREVAHGVASSYGATVDVQLNDSAHQPVADDETVTRKFVDYVIARKDVKLAEAPVTMTSDDFGVIVDHIPGMMFWLGVGGENPLHSSKFAPSEEAIGPTVALVGEYLLQA